MRRDLDFYDLVRFREDSKRYPDRCPVCGELLKFNPWSGRYGQWAHFIRNTKKHEKLFGREVLDSPLNGVRVCSLLCNNAVQVDFSTRPVLCNMIASEVRNESD